MNNFYGILKVIEKSDIKIDYYNKLKMFFSLVCLDEENNTKFCLICGEDLIDNMYSKINIDSSIYVNGYVENKKDDNVNIDIDYILFA